MKTFKLLKEELTQILNENRIEFLKNQYKSINIGHDPYGQLDNIGKNEILKRDDKIPVAYIIKDNNQDKYKKDNDEVNKNQLKEEKGIFSDDYDYENNIEYNSQISKLHNELTKKFDFDKDEEKSIFEYSRKSFELNTHLLAHHFFNIPVNKKLNFYNKYKYNLNHLDRALTRRTLGRNLTVFSGTNSFDPSKHTKKVFNPETLQYDKLVHFPAYTSTSFNKHSALSFARERADENGLHHMLRIELTPRDRGAYIGNIYGHMNEYEYLLPRNTTIRIHKSKLDPNIPKLMVHHATIEHDVDEHDIEKNPEDLHKLNFGMIEFLHTDNNTHPNIKKHIINKNLLFNFNNDDSYVYIKSKIDDTDILHDLRLIPNAKVRYAVALNPNTRSDTLHDMRNDEDKDVRLGVVGNNNTHPDTLHDMRNDKDESVRWLIANHTNTRSDTLHEMRNDKDKSVRRGVAENNNTHPDTLHEMRNDENDGVRKNVAKNNNTHPDTLHDMRNDKNNYVRMYVAENKNTYSDTLHDLRNDESDNVRMYVAENENTHSDTLHDLRNDENDNVRWKVAENKNTHSDTLRDLRNDKDEYIRWCVAENLRKRNLI